MYKNSVSKSKIVAVLMTVFGLNRDQREIRSYCLAMHDVPLRAMIRGLVDLSTRTRSRTTFRF